MENCQPIENLPGELEEEPAEYNENYKSYPDSIEEELNHWNP